jgi:hypothetical protein
MGGNPQFGIGPEGNLLYAGCAIPDGVSFGPFVELTLSVPKVAKSGSDISSQVQVTARNTGDRRSRPFAVRLVLAQAPEMTNQVTFLPIDFQGLGVNQARTLSRLVRIPADRFGNNVICASAAEFSFVDSPVCSSIFILKRETHP